jgi:hypothetical protein
MDGRSLYNLNTEIFLSIPSSLLTDDITYKFSSVGYAKDTNSYQPPKLIENKNLYLSPPSRSNLLSFIELRQKATLFTIRVRILYIYPITKNQNHTILTLRVVDHLGMHSIIYVINEDLIENFKWEVNNVYDIKNGLIDAGLESFSSKSGIHICLFINRNSIIEKTIDDGSIFYLPHNCIHFSRIKNLIFDSYYDFIGMIVKIETNILNLAIENRITLVDRKHNTLQFIYWGDMTKIIPNNQDNVVLLIKDGFVNNELTIIHVIPNISFIIVNPPIDEAFKIRKFFLPQHPLNPISRISLNTYKYHYIYDIYTIKPIISYTFKSYITILQFLDPGITITNQLSKQGIPLYQLAIQFVDETGALDLSIKDEFSKISFLIGMGLSEYNIRIRRKDNIKELLKKRNGMKFEVEFLFDDIGEVTFIRAVSFIEKDIRYIDLTAF